MACNIFSPSPSLCTECFTNDLLKSSLCWGSWETRKRKWVLLAGRNTGWGDHRVELCSVGLPGGTRSSYPVNSLNCILQRPFPPGSVWAPPWHSTAESTQRRIYFKIPFSPPSFLLSILLPLCLPLSLFSVPFPLFLYLTLLLSFLPRGSVLGRLPPNLLSFGCPSTKHSGYKCAPPPHNSISYA